MVDEISWQSIIHAPSITKNSFSSYVRGFYGGNDDDPNDVLKVGLEYLRYGLRLPTVHAVEDDQMEAPQETVQGTEDVACEIPEVFADKEQVIPCDEDDEREACVLRRSEVRLHGLYNASEHIPPGNPFKLINDRYGRCLRPPAKTMKPK